jgi:hypothetical protein
MDQPSTPEAELFVPVRSGPAGLLVRLFRTPLGARTAVAFTGAEQLAAVLGADQPWVTLCEEALRELTAPLGVTALTVDPQLVAPAPRPLAPAAAVAVAA